MTGDWERLAPKRLDFTSDSFTRLDLAACHHNVGASLCKGQSHRAAHTPAATGDYYNLVGKIEECVRHIANVVDGVTHALFGLLFGQYLDSGRQHSRSGARLNEPAANASSPHRFVVGMAVGFCGWQFW